MDDPLVIGDLTVKVVRGIDLQVIFFAAGEAMNELWLPPGHHVQILTILSEELVQKIRLRVSTACTFD